MAGYIADEKIWSDFEVDWKDVLLNQKRPFFHSSNKMFTRNGALRRAEEFYRVIEKHLSHAFCITVNIVKYQNLISSYAFPWSLVANKKFKKLWLPHYFMYLAFLEISTYEKQQLGLTGPVDFIFDETANYKDLVNDAFLYTFYSAERLGIEMAALGKPPSFRDDKNCTPLQAADLLAYLIRRAIVTTGNWAGSEMPWKKIKSIPTLIADLGDDYFLKRLDSAFSTENQIIYHSYNS